MTKHDYTNLDAAIVAAIAARAGTLSFTEMHTGTVRAETQRLADAGNAGKPAWKSVPAWRILDRRLQSLRKAGRIQHSRKPEGWSLVQPGSPAA